VKLNIYLLDHRFERTSIMFAALSDAFDWLNENPNGIFGIEVTRQGLIEDTHSEFHVHTIRPEHARALAFLEKK